MGCDIHMHYQKVSKQQKREDKLSTIFEDVSDELEDIWVFIVDGPIVDYGYQFCNENRNYFWFGRLSEVRRDGPRITEPGFPDGFNPNDYHHHYYSINGDDDNDDGMYFGDHSFSHIYLDKLLEVEWTTDDKSGFGWFINEDIPKMVDYCKRNGLKTNEFRILIGYDS